MVYLRYFCRYFIGSDFYVGKGFVKSVSSTTKCDRRLPVQKSESFLRFWWREGDLLRMTLGIQLFDYEFIIPLLNIFCL